MMLSIRFQWVLVALVAASALVPVSADAATITFFDLVGGGVTFTTDDPTRVTAFDCPGNTEHCIVQVPIPQDAGFLQCSGAVRGCPPVIANVDGITVSDIVTDTFASVNGQLYGRYGLFSEKVPGMFIENGYEGVFPPGTVGFGSCQDYFQGCHLTADGTLQTAFTWSYYNTNGFLSPPLRLLGSDTVRFEVFDAPPAADPAPVPEPSTLALLGMGLAGIMFVRRTRPSSAHARDHGSTAS
jgi:hypothetical protein